MKLITLLVRETLCFSLPLHSSFWFQMNEGDSLSVEWSEKCNWETRMKLGHIGTHSVYRIQTLEM